MNNADTFDLASRAFRLMTLREQYQALEAFAKLRFPAIEDRWFEAVHSVVSKAHVSPPQRTE